MGRGHVRRTKRISVNERCLVSSIVGGQEVRQKNHGDDHHQGGCVWHFEDMGSNLICCNASPEVFFLQCPYLITDNTLHLNFGIIPAG